MSNIEDYYKLKKQAKQQIKSLEAEKHAENKRIAKFQKLLIKYFDHKGKGLTKAEIMEVNNYLKEYVVLSNEKEISNATTLLTTYITIAKKKLAEMRLDITERLDNGEIIDKSDAVIVTKNLIIDKQKIERVDVVNGKKRPVTVVEGKKYVVNYNDKTMTLDTKKYEQESMDGMNDIDSQIKKFKNVKSLAYSGNYENMGL